MLCNVLETTHLIGKKWSIALLSDIRMNKFKGFYNFTVKTKITPRTLSQQLKELEKAGLIKKRIEEGGYSLTLKGEEMCKLIDEIKKWNIKWNTIPEDCLKRSCSECKLFFGNNIIARA